MTSVPTPSSRPEYGRADSELRGASRSLGFVCSIDAEQGGAFAGNAHHVLAVICRRHVVAIGDSAIQWTNAHGLTSEKFAGAHEPLDVCPLVHNTTV